MDTQQNRQTGDTPLDVLVIGGGQAGLAAGYQLAAEGLRFQIVDGADRIGASWLLRYESLQLFTPRAYSALPGRTMDGDQDGYPNRAEMAQYLESYAAKLPIRLGTKIVELVKSTSGTFVARTSVGDNIVASQVIVATGSFQTPIVPDYATQMNIQQLTPETYRNQSTFSGNRVLVVGDGASGRDIALELARAGRNVMLSSGKPRRLFPETVLGKSIWWWLDRFGLMKVGPNSLIGRRMKAFDAFPDRGRSIAAMKAEGIEIVARTVGGDRNIVRLSDGTHREVDAIIWCIGYGDDTEWMKAPGAISSGRFAHERGRSPVDGLFYVGRPWQRNRASGLVMGVGDDAREIIGYIAGRNQRRRPTD